MADSCMVMFKAGSCNLDTAERAFHNRGFKLSVRREGHCLVAGSAKGPEFRVVLVTGPSVRLEAEGIGKGTPHADGMRECDGRFEVLIDDLDSALDEINTLIEVQATLQEISKGYLFLAWNGNLMSPDQIGS